LGLASVDGDSYGWTPFYSEEYLIIKKCDGHIGNQISYENVYEYYFKEPFVLRYNHGEWGIMPGTTPLL